jgi:hypothetical protein
VGLYKIMRVMFRFVEVLAIVLDAVFVARRCTEAMRSLIVYA